MIHKDGKVMQISITPIARYKNVLTIALRNPTDGV
jgi:hypothetical protein